MCSQTKSTLIIRITSIWIEPHAELRPDFTRRFLTALLVAATQQWLEYEPDDPEWRPSNGLTPPARAIRMIDRIEAYIPDGGPLGLGYIQATKIVDPREWFFDAHFYQDPVLPGSLGIESFIQMLKYIACQRWHHLSDSHRFTLATAKLHSWTYRGQILPKNRLITVEAVVTEVTESPLPTITATGYLHVDGLCIYKLENFGIALVPL